MKLVQQKSRSSFKITKRNEICQIKRPNLWSYRLRSASDYHTNLQSGDQEFESRLCQLFFVKKIFRVALFFSYGTTNGIKKIFNGFKHGQIGY